MDGDSLSSKSCVVGLFSFLSTALLRQVDCFEKRKSRSRSTDNFHLSFINYQPLVGRVTLGRYFNSCDWRDAWPIELAKRLPLAIASETNWGQEGTVRSVQRGVTDISEDKLTIKWDDGIVDIDGYNAGEHALVSRALDRK